MAENTILSLCIPCPTPAVQARPVDETMTNAFQSLCNEISHSHHCQVILDVSLNNAPAKKRLSIETHQSVYNVTISGAYQNVVSARGALMRSSPLKPKLSVKISKASISADSFPESTTSPVVGSNDTTSSSTDESVIENSNPDTQQPELTLTLNSSSEPSAPSTTVPFCYFPVLPEFKSQVDQISSSTKTTITLVSSQFHALPSVKSAAAAHARQEMVELLVSGSWEDAEAARLLLLVAIDALQPNVVQEKIQVELKFQNMVGGRKRQILQDLMAKTRTNIYMASPFVQTSSKNSSPLDSRYNDVYITGEPDKVQVAKDVISKAYTRVQAAASAYTRQVSIASRKLDWMLLNHRDRLRSIMNDNATFIAFPPLGATHPVIIVYGESRVNVERTIRTVMQLSSQFHSGSINILSPVRENLLAIPMNPSNVLSPVANISKLVSQASGAEVEFRNNGFLIFGNEIQTRIAVQFLTDVDFIKTHHYEVRFSVELANEHREFISGKKNGKINRIMKATGAKIKFDPCNEYNFYVDLSSTIAVKAVEALSLLQEELPAEISFYVPETYHKRIIGVGGKNIQRIMKKYGVYVKFSNSEEFANLGGYFDNLDNVVARTPSKNAMNLENLKHAVMELVNPKDKDFVHHSISIPKQYHLSLLSDHAAALSEIHDATNATVRFPEKETGSDVICISGPECYIQQAISMLLSLVDEQYVYPVPFSEAMDRVLAKPEFKSEVLDKIKNEWNVTLVLPHPRDITDTTTTENGSRAEANIESKSSAASSSVPKSQGAVNRLGSEDHNDGPKSEGAGELARSLSSLTDSGDDDDDSEEEDHVFVFKYSRNNEEHLQSAKELLVKYLVHNQIEVYDDEIRVQRPRSDSFAEAFPHFNCKILSSVTGGELPAPVPAFSNYSLFQNTGNAFESLNRIPSSGVSGPNSSTPGTGSMVAPDIRALFSHGPSQGLPLLTPSPPRWTDHSRQQTSLPGVSIGANSSTVTSGPSYSPIQALGAIQHNSHSPSSNRLTSLPNDPWASPGKQQQQQQQQQKQHIPSNPGYPGAIGQYRTPPPGINNVGGNGFYSPNQQMFSPEGPYGGTMGFQTPVSSSHLYSGNNSPVQGSSSNVANYTNILGSHSPRQQQQQQQQHHQPSPQRPLSGSFISRGDLQFIEDKMASSPSFGPGYGPALNSGITRSHQQIYQQQSPFGQSMQYPQQRQRHSSHNSVASHHTMFLGPIGGGLGSTGGSVNSDDISTEDESDDAFDDMRNRYRSYPYQHQGIQATNGNFSSQTPSPSVVANRRGSVPSMGSMYSNQQLCQSGSPNHSSSPLPNVVRLSNSSSDLYGRKSLVNAMARHSIGQQTDVNFGPNRSSGGGFGGGLTGANMPNLASGSVFGNERDLFSSGLGGIIGGGTISHSSSNSSFNTLNTHTNNQIHKTGGGNSPTAGLSPSALPFLADSPLDRTGQHLVGDWDR
ncbi:hypothetical protein BGZ80_001742 [Entomortierella chlamydospora]|uniref:K Homology domain-containing protein n=1 Tax=Entomortierella chlamydospora TaxID=101097 RepID=A0A9P6SXK7_9FUNG|nr:hypothetical protein BGZ80_001742 [Entomortierella chlamydospora]